MSVITIIGGMYSRKKIEELEKNHNITIYVHDGLKPKRKVIHALIAKSDCTVIITSFCCHKSMLMAKDIAKQTKRPTVFPKATNANFVVEQGLQTLKRA